MSRTAQPDIPTSPVRWPTNPKICRAWFCKPKARCAKSNSLAGLRQTPTALMLAVVIGVVGGVLGVTLYRVLKRLVAAWQLASVSIVALIAGYFFTPYFRLGCETPGAFSACILSHDSAGARPCLRSFYELLKRPAIHGRRTLDEVDGFRMYLKTAEEDRLAELHPPRKTPELFEQYLPYDLALEVENEWAQSFSQVLAAAANEPGQGVGYVPLRYSGGHTHVCLNSASLSRSPGNSLTSTIASAATPPGLSSGFGSSDGGSSGGFGGGFSGGFSGGGGGGGGGL